MAVSNYGILIADDEPIECIALETLLKNHFPDLRIFPSVSNGVDFVAGVGKYSPDIVIVDINMPGINGLDALDMLRNRYPEMKIIIHSAYSEFEYAKRAFSLNVVDYMVKPVQKSVFIETMRKILESLGEERQKKSSEEMIHQLTGEVNRLAEHDIMSSILLGEINSRASQIFLRSLNQEYEGGLLVTVRQPGNPIRMWDRKAGDEIIVSLNQVCLCIGRTHYQDLLLYLIPGSGIGEDNYRKWAGHLLESLNRSLLFGVSTWKFTLDELPDGQKESSAALIGKQDPGVFFFEYGIAGHIHNVFRDEKEYLAGLLASGKTKECCRGIEKLLLQAKAREVPLDAMKTCSAYFLLFLHREMAKRYSSPLYESGYIPGAWKTLWNCASYEELNENLCLAVCQLAGLLFHPMNKSWEYVAKAFLYIKKMYSRNISLEDVAALVGISPFYLSRLLKQELNETFVEILTKVRVAEALALLRDSGKTIRQIGEEVGYSNTTYFYKVFKKQTGMTVGEVRRYL